MARITFVRTAVLFIVALLCTHARAADLPQAIARWNAVPHQDISEPFPVGVVAHHINGIAFVVFSVDGQPIEFVESPSINPRTGSEEYWFELDPAEYPSPIRLTAEVIPNLGAMRALRGPDDASPQSLRGEHELVVNVVAPGTTRPVAYCSQTGSDETGDGSRENPYRQPAFAAAQVNDADQGATIKLLPGDYLFGPKPFPRAVSKDRWITVEPAEGVSRSQVRIIGTGAGGFGNEAELVRLRNITLSGSDIRITGDKVWLDSCAVIGVRTLDYKVIARNWSTKTYATDCFVTQSRNGLRGAYLMRGIDCGVISGSPFGDSAHVVDCTISLYDNSGTTFHGGVFHWYPEGPIENIIVQDVTAADFWSQGMMTETNHPGARVDDIAIIRVTILKGEDNSAGSWWETSTDHLIFHDCVIPDQPFRWRLSDFGSTLSNVSIRGNTFRNFAWDRIHEQGFFNVNIAGNDFLDLIDKGAYAVGTPKSDAPPLPEFSADATTTGANPGDPGYGVPDGQVDGADLAFYMEAWRAQNALE